MSTKKYNVNSPVLFDKKTGDIILNDSIPYDGTLLIHKHTQATAANVWMFQLPYKCDIVLPFMYKDNGDGTYSEVVPVNLDIVDGQVITATFDQEITGVANVLICTESTPLDLI
jgi:hypothetical protein